MKKIIIILAVLTLSTKVNAQTWVNIPDANFRAYLQGIIPSAMSGGSLNISSTLVTITTTMINVPSSGISNLTGVQYFSSLKMLICYTNSLVSLPTLPNSLTYLSCKSNSLTSLPALPNSITFLDCNFNSLTSLPNVPNLLQSLFCSWNNLVSLPALPNSLTFIECTNNNLINLPALPNTLQVLYLQNNSLTSLPVLPNTLTTLIVTGNNISCFPTFPNSITNFAIIGNPYTCLPNYVLPVMNSYTTTPLCVAGNTNGCAVAGFEEYNANNVGFKMYPNPTDKILNVELEISNGDNNYNAIITNNLGQIVLKEEIYFIDKNSYINVNNLPNGIYLLKLKGNNSSTITKKVIITH
jgi:Leucine-rich repeat (LRR) protein